MVCGTVGRIERYRGSRRKPHIYAVAAPEFFNSVACNHTTTPTRLLQSRQQTTYNKRNFPVVLLYHRNVFYRYRLCNGLHAI